MQDSDTILSLLVTAKDAGASDLILAAGAPPSMYVNTRLTAMSEERLSASNLNDIVTTFLTENQRGRLESHRDIDFSFAHALSGRCRVNVHYQRRSIAVAIRLIQSELPKLEELRLPAKLDEMVEMPRGLVLVTGPTGSGKSTTLAALIERMNQQRRVHVITLEDPIEFTFSNKNSIIEQREIGDDSPSFADALRHVVRQKPDVIMVGEMRDQETISATLTAAETGHLVFASLHTNSAAQTIDRVVDAFDSQRQEQIRSQLSASLRAIVCQTLFSNNRDGGMAPAIELMVVIPAIARAIRDNNTHLIDGMIETGGQQGMQTLDAAIAELVSAGIIDIEMAMSKAADTARLERLLARGISQNELLNTATGGGGAKSHAGGSNVHTARKPWE